MSLKDLKTKCKKLIDFHTNTPKSDHKLANMKFSVSHTVPPKITALPAKTNQETVKPIHDKYLLYFLNCEVADTLSAVCFTYQYISYDKGLSHVDVSVMKGALSDLKDILNFGDRQLILIPDLQNACDNFLGDRNSHSAKAYNQDLKTIKNDVKVFNNNNSYSLIRNN